MRGLMISDPGSPPLLRDGFPQAFRPEAPAAGDEFASQVPGGYFERLLAVSFRLTTSSVVGNRSPSILFVDASGNVLLASGPAVTVPADQTQMFSFHVWQVEAEWPVASRVLSPLAAYIMRPTDSWYIECAALDDADQISNITYVSERFFSDSPIPGRDYGDDQ